MHTSLRGAQQARRKTLVIIAEERFNNTLVRLRHPKKGQAASDEQLHLPSKERRFDQNPQGLKRLLPYFFSAAEIEILSPGIDERMGFTRFFKNTTQRAKVRCGVAVRVARFV